MPNRPPCVQKSIVLSLIVHVETPSGIDSVVMSKNLTICRGCWHSLSVVSAVTRDEIPHLTHFEIRIFGRRHAQQRERRMRADVRRKIHARYLRIGQIRVGWILGAVQKLFAVENLQHSASRRAIRQVKAIAFRSGRHRAMQIAGHRPGGAGLLARAIRNSG